MRPDFGEDEKWHLGVRLTCKRVAPDLTLQDLVRIFEDAKKMAGPSDHLSANPSKWPDVRGVIAVTEAVLVAVYGRDTDCRADAKGKCVWPECPREIGRSNCPLDLQKSPETT
jgi:hypothetical protein